MFFWNCPSPFPFHLPGIKRWCTTRRSTSPRGRREEVGGPPRGGQLCQNDVSKLLSEEKCWQLPFSASASIGLHSEIGTVEHESINYVTCFVYFTANSCGQLILIVHQSGWLAPAFRWLVCGLPMCVQHFVVVWKPIVRGQFFLFNMAWVDACSLITPFKCVIARTQQCLAP